MVRIAPVKLQYSTKVLWFDPRDVELVKGDAVVVKTARGIEFGYMNDDILEVEESDLKRLKTELKPVERRAHAADKEKARKMQKCSEDALPVFKEMAAEMNKDMHPVSVEFLLNGDKAVFFFESEERVDFRELVRKLAARFHVRIDMRQIGVRDEARIVGGYGHCGQELCCKRFGGNFNPVSIRMAKEQDLSLNPLKISGVCGRLMCCLRYEYEAYKDFKGRAPKVGTSIDTPEGKAKVVDLDVPREIVIIQLEGEKRVKIPLKEMEPPEKGSRPSRIGKEAFDLYANQSPFAALDAIGMSKFGSGLFGRSLTDGALATSKTASRTGGKASERPGGSRSASKAGASKKDPGTGSGRTGGRRSRGAQTTSTQPGGGRAGIGRAGSGRTGGDRQGTGRTKAGLRDVVRTGANSSPDTQRTPRRRVTLGAGGELTEQKGLGEAKQPSPQPEPRQKGQAGKDQAVNKGKKRANQRQGRKGAKGAQNAGRDPGSEAKQGKNRQGQGLRSPQAKAGKHNQGERGGQQASGPRPGHRSSGLRKEQPGEARGHAPTAGTPAASSPRNQGTLPGGSPSATPNRTPNASLSSPSSAPVPPTSARKPRQRSHSAGSSQAGKADES